MERRNLEQTGSSDEELGAGGPEGQVGVEQEVRVGDPETPDRNLDEMFRVGTASDQPTEITGNIQGEIARANEMMQNLMSMFMSQMTQKLDQKFSENNQASHAKLSEAVQQVSQQLEANKQALEVRLSENNHQVSQLESKLELKLQENAQQLEVRLIDCLDARSKILEDKLSGQVSQLERKLTEDMQKQKEIITSSLHNKIQEVDDRMITTAQDIIGRLETRIETRREEVMSCIKTQDSKIDALLTDQGEVRTEVQGLKDGVHRELRTINDDIKKLEDNDVRLQQKVDSHIKRWKMTC